MLSVCCVRVLFVMFDLFGCLCISLGAYLSGLFDCLFV